MIWLWIYICGIIILLILGLLIMPADQKFIKSLRGFTKELFNLKKSWCPLLLTILWPIALVIFIIIVIGLAICFASTPELHQG
ncbi:MAG: hypothetical protein A2927_01540 [Candidatus Komeilibacteria bacterium RIFCSPLOWO2_01_FULL_45_10]|uniref:Uncharacterized protein n=1 Tax=Candidatus Komeilibacteria bacterium RIFCSPLOWO2_01_FULL_45_10 TaxID=1798550 RepID=A0A1G2BHU3_9BACT|nr:MAG: hypothetical protein A2927_01540 [Candidatus Komeilibacteria bacterium RIFCSPLOWO2_01_FULL_45_10]